MPNRSTHHPPPWLPEYDALTRGVGWVDFHDRTQVEISGPDRLAFFHNFCTNEIRKLPEGAGCEAFITTVQGKIVAYVTVFSGPNALVLETVPGQAERIITHLDRYLIREQVTLRDRSQEWGELLLSGAECEALLAPLVDGPLPRDMLASAERRLDDVAIWARRVAMTGTIGFLLDGLRESMDGVAAWLTTAGATPCGPEAFNAARLEAGTPLFGLDVSDGNLPQEVARDSQTISFTKGCYLGQETVARIDALGHVNKTLCGVRFDGDAVPASGALLRAGDSSVGEVTSASYSPRLGAPIALAYLRRGYNEVGAELESAQGRAHVVPLPLTETS